MQIQMRVLVLYRAIQNMTNAAPVCHHANRNTSQNTYCVTNSTNVVLVCHQNQPASCTLPTVRTRTYLP